jgi:hypothetical protein
VIEGHIKDLNISPQKGEIVFARVVKDFAFSDPDLERERSEWDIIRATDALRTAVMRNSF